MDTREQYARYVLPVVAQGVESIVVAGAHGRTLIDAEGKSYLDCFSGISVVNARLTSMTTMFHSQLVEHATPFNDALRMPNASMVWGHGLPSMAMLEGIITQQAAMMAYSNDFLFMTLISLCAFPLLALIRSPKAVATASREAAAHAVMD